MSSGNVVQLADALDRRVPARLLDAADLYRRGTGNGTAGPVDRSDARARLPFGSRINVLSFSFYTVKAADFNLPATS